MTEKENMSTVNTADEIEAIFQKNIERASSLNSVSINIVQYTENPTSIGGRAAEQLYAFLKYARDAGYENSENYKRVAEALKFYERRRLGKC